MATLKAVLVLIAVYILRLVQCSLHRQPWGLRISPDDLSSTRTSVF